VDDEFHRDGNGKNSKTSKHNEEPKSVPAIEFNTSINFWELQRQEKKNFELMQRQQEKEYLQQLKRKFPKAAAAAPVAVATPAPALPSSARAPHTPISAASSFAGLITPAPPSLEPASVSASGLDPAPAYYEIIVQLCIL
jgi:hypothetical protein